MFIFCAFHQPTGDPAKPSHEQNCNNSTTLRAN